MNKFLQLCYCQSQMFTFEDLNTITSPSKPCALTIGNFDGVHLGHQQILKRMRAIVGRAGTVAVLTFSNHPSFILPGKTPIRLIFSKSLKLKYLEKFGVDIIYCLEFTPELSQMRYNAFIEAIRKSCPFDHLIFGEGDAFGYKREGTEEKMKPLSKELGFQLEYLPKLMSSGETISSARIRTCIQQGELAKATTLLGHPYVLEGTIDSGQLTLPPHLCLPPNGDYPVIVEHDSFQNKTIAHIETEKISLDFPMTQKKICVTFE